MRTCPYCHQHSAKPTGTIHTSIPPKYAYQCTLCRETFTVTAGEQMRPIYKDSEIVGICQAILNAGRARREMLSFQRAVLAKLKEAQANAPPGVPAQVDQSVLAVAIALLDEDYA